MGKDIKSTDLFYAKPINCSDGKITISTISDFCNAPMFYLVIGAL